MPDLAAFVPQFRELNEQLFIEGEIKGVLSQFSIKDFELKYGSNIKAHGDFFFKGLPTLDKLYVVADIKNISTTAIDLEKILTSFSSKNIKLPSFLNTLGLISYSGNLKGYISDCKSDGVLTTAAGVLYNNVILSANDHTFEKYKVTGQVKTTSYNLARLFGDKSKLGNTTFGLSVELEKNGKDDFSVIALGNVDSLIYNNYEYLNVSVNGKFNHNGFDGSLIVSDKNAEMSFKGNIDLNKEKPVFRFVADVQTLNLSNLNFIKQYENSILSFEIETNLPGISGSFILVLLGKYMYIMSSIKEFNIPVIAVFGLGACIGIISFSNVLSYLLNKYHDLTIATLAGFMFGSLNKIWPWKETLETYVDRHGIIKPLVEKNILPNQLLVEGISLMVVGLILVIALENISER